MDAHPFASMATYITVLVWQLVALHFLFGVGLKVYMSPLPCSCARFLHGSFDRATIASAAMKKWLMLIVAVAVQLNLKSASGCL